MKTPLIMGILNVTPDSFSDGGLYLSPEKALKKAESLVLEGADIIDIGGESTRPGATAVPVQEELDRTIPIVESVAKHFEVEISIDTCKPEVAAEAVSAGASIINDVTSASDIRMAEIAREYQAILLLCHMKGTPQSMQESPVYRDGVVTEVQRAFKKKVSQLIEMGISKDLIWIDPGIGFGKTVHHNLDLLRHLDMFVGLAGRLAIGTSRKSFLGKIAGTDDTNIEDRAAGTFTTNLWAYEKGASVFRVHDVANMKRSFKTWDAIRFGVL